MELQLGKQKRMMYARVFDRTEEETCSADAVVPDALGDIGAIVVTEGTFCLWNLDFSDKSAQIEGSVAADVVYEEEGGALRSFPVELPVKVRINGETLSPRCAAMAAVHAHCAGCARGQFAQGARHSTAEPVPARLPGDGACAHGPGSRATAAQYSRARKRSACRFRCLWRKRHSPSRRRTASRPGSQRLTVCSATRRPC